VGARCGGSGRPFPPKAKPRQVLRSLPGFVWIQLGTCSAQLDPVRQHQNMIRGCRRGRVRPQAAEKLSASFRDAAISAVTRLRARPGMTPWIFSAAWFGEMPKRLIPPRIAAKDCRQGLFNDAAPKWRGLFLVRSCHRLPRIAKPSESRRIIEYRPRRCSSQTTQSALRCPTCPLGCAGRRVWSSRPSLARFAHWL
jgi:hypothetical protein